MDYILSAITGCCAVWLMVIIVMGMVELMLVTSPCQMYYYDAQGTARAACAAAVVRDCIYVFGGFDYCDSHPLSVSLSQKMAAGTIYLHGMDVARAGLCAMAVGSYIYILGGDGKHISMEVLDTNFKRWKGEEDKNIPDMPEDRAFAAAILRI